MSRTLAVLLAPLLLAACAQLGVQPSATIVRYGTVTRIANVALVGDPYGRAALVGGIVGALVGAQVGQGAGNAAAEAGLGTVGVLAGQAVGRHGGERRVGQYVVVWLRNGDVIAVTQAADPVLRVGDAVRVEGVEGDERLVRL